MFSTFVLCCLACSLRVSFASVIHSYPITDLHYSTTHDKKVVCYFASWSTFRDSNRKFDVEKINPYLCTHLIYAFAGLSVENKIRPLNAYLDIGLRTYERFTNLKLINPRLKTLLSIGGWNEGSLRYSLMAENVTARRVFVDSVVEYLQKYDFDGLDLDWEYPASRGGKPSDKNNLSLLLKELRTAFNAKGYLLSISGAATKETIDDGYDVHEVSKHVDWINLMTYDYHTSNENVTGPNAPLFSKLTETWETNTKNVNFTVNYWLQKGAPKDKLLMGLAAYGQGFNLKDANIHGFDALTHRKGEEGPLMEAPRAFGFNEICSKIKKENWTVVEDPYTLTAYTFNGHKWISFDNLNGISYKTVYSRYLRLAGVVIWSIDVDDFDGECNELRNQFTILQRVNNVFQLIDTKLPAIVTNPTTPSAVTYEAKSTTVAFTTKPTYVTISSTLRPTSTTSSPSPSTHRHSTAMPPSLTTTSSSKRFIASSSTTTTTTTTTTAKPTTTPATKQTTSTATTAKSTSGATQSSIDQSESSKRGSSTPSTPTPNAELKCPYSGTFKHPTDCKKFYVCIYRGEKNNRPNYVPYEYFCPDETFFDSLSMRCAWAHEVPDCVSYSALEQIL